MTEERTHDEMKALDESIELQRRRIDRARREERSVLAQTLYLGTLGLVFVLPVAGATYLGHWLDGLTPGYSTRWTISLLFVGIVVGAINVYLLIRD